MSRIFASPKRRAHWLLTPAKLRRASLSIKKATAGLLINAMVAPLSAMVAKPIKRRKKPSPTSDKTPLNLVKNQRKAHATGPEAADLKARTTAPQATARFLDRQHTDTAGSVAYKIYLPGGSFPAPTGLILMLHGCSQTPEDFARGTHMNSWAEKHGLVVVYPAQTERHNAACCWNWFKPGNQSRGSGEPAVLASLTRKLSKQFKLSRDCVFVAGLSAGGAMAAILADVYPDVFSAAGIHSGLARGSARNILSAMTVMRKGGAGSDTAAGDAALPYPVRRIVFHGEADTTVHPSNAKMIVDAALGAFVAPTKVIKRSVRGRGYTRSDFTGSGDVVHLELWMVEGATHAWSGGRPTGSFTDATGPDASAQMVRFFIGPFADQ